MPPPAALLDAIRAFVLRPAGTIAVGTLHEPVRDALKTPAATALLSAETMAKQPANHGDLVPEDYLLIPLALDDPTVIAGQLERRVVMFRAGIKIVRIVLKATEDRSEVYVTSFHFTDPRKAQRFLRKHPVLFGAARDLEE